MTGRQNETVSDQTLAGLDADVLLAVRENMEAAPRLADGPSARRIPETMCLEIEQVLRLRELTVRQQSEFRLD